MTGKRSRKWFNTLLALRGGLLGDPIANFGRRVKDASVIADLGEAPEAADSSGGGKRLKVSVIDFGRKARGPDLIEADVLVEVEGKPVRADGAVEGDEHLPLLGVADALNRSDQSRALRHEKLLVVGASNNPWLA